MNDIGVALRDITAVMERFGISYAVIGGVAVRAYGIPRPTYDLDFTIEIPRERLADLFDAVENEGYTVAESYRSGWIDEVAGMPLVKFRCYIQGQGVDVDIFIAEKPFQRELLKRRQRVETPDGDTWLASPEDIILLKLLAHRPRDMSDIGDILFTQGELDWGYLRRWADLIGVREPLEAVLKQRDKYI